MVTDNLSKRSPHCETNFDADIGGWKPCDSTVDLREVVYVEALPVASQWMCGECRRVAESAGAVLEYDHHVVWTPTTPGPLEVQPEVAQALDTLQANP